MYDPWADFSSRYPRLAVGSVILDDTTAAAWKDSTLYLNAATTHAEQRSTLAREVAALNGEPPERAAELLIPLGVLSDAVTAAILAGVALACNIVEADAEALVTRIGALDATSLYQVASAVQHTIVASASGDTPAVA